MTTFVRTAAGGHRASGGLLLLLLCVPPVALAAAIRPLEVLVALAVLAAVVICMVRIEFAVLLLVVTAPLEFLITFGSGSQLTITKLAGAVCFSAFALNALSTRRRLIFDSAHALVFLLLAIALVSMLQAEQLSPAIVTTTRYASFVALFFVVSQFVGAHRLQRRIAWTLSIGSTITGVLASWNFLSGATLSARVGPGAGAPGDIAFILATTLPFTMWLLRERGVRRAAALVMTVAIAVSIVLTLSRGALVGVGAGLVWYTIAERRNGRALAAGFIAIGLALFLVVRLESHSIETGLHAKAKVASENVQTRLEAWDAAANLAADHPFLGVGPGNFQFHYIAATGRPAGTPVLVAHDAYLDMASELGLVAFVAFVAYLALAFTRLTTAVRRRLGPPVYASALRASLVIAVVAAITLSEQYFAPFWLLGGLASALIHERRSVPEAE